jgi:hypothetical protein
MRIFTSSCTGVSPQAPIQSKGPEYNNLAGGYDENVVDVDCKESPEYTENTNSKRSKNE